MIKLGSYLFILIGLIACAPASGPHKIIEKPDTTSGMQETSIDYDQVREVFVQYCSRCHPSRVQPNWLEYSQAKEYVDNGILERRVIIEKDMPQQGSPEARQISEDDRQIIAQWIDAGGPRRTMAQTKQGQQRAEGEERVTSEVPVFARKCLSCHSGQQMAMSSAGIIPFIMGQNPEYIVDQLNAYKSLKRIDPDFEMNRVAHNLNKIEIERLANYFSRGETSPNNGKDVSMEFSEDILMKGKKVAEIACHSCHGKRETSIERKVPNINGQNFYYIRFQLRNYQQGKYRNNKLMTSLSQKLTPAQLEAVSAYFSSQK